VYVSYLNLEEVGDFHSTGEGALAQTLSTINKTGNLGLRTVEDCRGSKSYKGVPRSLFVPGDLAC